MKSRQTPYVEEIFEESDELNTLKTEFRAIPAEKLISTIQDRLNDILNSYLENRTENPKEYTNLFKAGYSKKEKQFAIAAFKSLIDGKLNVMTEENINVLRNGHLGKALRAETHQLAKRANMKEIGSIHEMVAYLQYHFFKEGPIADKLNQEREKVYNRSIY